ncbi:RNase H domain-containing protein [Caerostris darwini]|uniref:RNase H domain-containing protein n=1 Tax=Caerostris darwini TaxID=1538125 RepID=A0AAV4WZ51_9ARAC|nr:RNase H domain-containing protein [Caerostris darwini]
MLNILYPDPEWLRILTDRSLLSKAGAGVFSEIFSFYVPVGRGTAFDGEIAAIRTALYQLQCHLEKFTRVVILCDSRAALLAIVSNNNPKTQDILDCRYHPENLASLEKTIVLQWVSAPCGVPGNEKADFLAKMGALITQKNISSYTLSLYQKFHQKIN